MIEARPRHWLIQAVLPGFEPVVIESLPPDQHQGATAEPGGISYRQKTGIGGAETHSDIVIWPAAMLLFHQC